MINLLLMRRTNPGALAAIMIALALLLAPSSQSAELPRILYVGPDFGGDFAAAFSRALPETVFMCGGLSARDIRDRLGKLPGDSRSQILLMNLPNRMASSAAYARELREILALARARHMEPLWFEVHAGGAALTTDQQAVAGVLRATDVMSVDFGNFSRTLRSGAPDNEPLTPKLRQRQGEFLAESVQQWWTACAASNPTTRHEKLWPAHPPAYEYAGPERVNSSARIDHVTEPEVIRFFPKKRDHATAVVFFPGGGYAYLGFLRNAKELADRLDPLGIAVIGLKYRTGRLRDVTLRDAQRAVRYVRTHAAEWGIDPARIGVAGQSAGANLVLNLAGHYGPGDPGASDPVERTGCRPDFVIALTSWHFGESTTLFPVPPDMPPVFLRHARNDSDFKLAEQIVARLQAGGVPLDYKFIDSGGHGAFELSPVNPGADWPDDLVGWLRRRGLLAEPVR